MGNSCCCCVNAREAVSKKKKRTIAEYKDELKTTVPPGGVNLDLVPVHARIIAMGFPASGVEAWYRNPYPDVKAYLDLNFKTNYMVYNLCAEKQHRYDTAKYFDGRVREYPFWDHKPCRLSLIPTFVHDAVAYLGLSEHNVAVIHCKAGKGRTGVMACCLMMALDQEFYANPDHTVTYYGTARTKDGRGLTHRSQIRYVRYWGQLQRHWNGNIPAAGVPTVALRSIALHGLNALEFNEVLIEFAAGDEEKSRVFAKSSLPADQWDASMPGSVTVHVSSPSEPTNLYSVSPSKSTSPEDISVGPLQVRDDFRIELRKSGKCVAALSVHTMFLERSYNWKELDKAYKRTDLTDDARVDLNYVRV